MVSEEEVRKMQPYLQTKIDSMKNLTKEYKKSIDECNPASISSDAISIGILRENLENNKKYLTANQYEEIENLKREYALQFQRLNIEKVCECKPKIKENRR
jgi:hypothetical protein